MRKIKNPKQTNRFFFKKILEFHYKETWTLECNTVNKHIRGKYITDRLIYEIYHDNYPKLP